MINSIINKKNIFLALILLCSSPLLQGMAVHATAPESAAVEISPDFPDFRTFTQSVLKGCPEYNYGWTLAQHKERQAALRIQGPTELGIPAGLAKIITPKQFNLLANKFIENNPTNEPYILKKTIRKGSDICFVGDIHGSVHSLIRIIWTLIARGYINENLQINDRSFHLVFLGDYIDSGRYNLLTLALLLKLRNNNPNNVVLIRGNHEQALLDGCLGDRELAIEIGIEPISDTEKRSLYTHCQEVFSRLPVTFFFTLTGMGHIRCCHGGYFSDQAEENVICWLTDGNIDKYPLSLLADDCNGLTDGMAQKRSRFADDAPAATKYNEKTLTYEAVWRDFKADNARPSDRSGSAASIAYTHAKGMIEATETQEQPAKSGRKRNRTDDLSRTLAVFRGHQDQDCDLNFLPEILESATASGLLYAIDDLNEFAIKSDDYLPIFTLTTASEGKCLPTTSCVILNTDAPYEKWQAERVRTVLGSLSIPPATYLQPLRHYPNTDTGSGKIEGLYSRMIVHQSSPKNPGHIILEWSNLPYLEPLEITSETDISPMPELTPAPEPLH